MQGDDDNMFGDVPEEPKNPQKVQELAADLKENVKEDPKPLLEALANPEPPTVATPALGTELVKALGTIDSFPGVVQTMVPDPVEIKKFVEKEKQAEMLLNKLFLKGRMVKVSIGCPEFRKKLTNVDIGKTKAEVPDEIISLGQKRLIKKSALAEIKSIQGMANKIVTSHSHESWIPMLRFMKDETAAKVKEELLKIRVDYMKLAEKFAKEYPALKEETLKEFPKWADKLQPYYPSPEKVKKSFYFEMSGFDDWRITIVRKEAEILGDAKLAIKESLMGKLNEFLASSVLDARTQFLEALQGVKEKLDAGEKVNEKTIKKIHEMIEEAKAKNITEDTEFFSMLDGFSKKFTADAAKDKKAFKNEIAKDLDAILAATTDEKAAEKVAEEYVHRSIIV